LHFDNKPPKFLKIPELAGLGRASGQLRKTAWRANNSVFWLRREPSAYYFRASLAFVSGYETDRAANLNKASRTLSFCLATAGISVRGRQLLGRIDAW